MKARIWFNQKAQFNSLIMSFVVITAAVLLLAAPKTALGQIYVGGNTTIGEYDAATGAPINSTLASGSDGTAVSYLALSGNDLYAAAGVPGDWFNTRVTHYTVANGLVTSSTTYTLSHWNVRGIALSGNTLYADYNAANGTDSIGLFNAQTGAAINGSFITGLQVDVVRNLELVGNVLYVSNKDRVGAYDATTGAAINSSLVSGWDEIDGVALKGNSLFVAGWLNGTGTIGEYDATSGAAINSSFVTGLDGPGDVAVVGNNLYVANYNSGTIGEYDATSGAAINSSLVSGLSAPKSIVVVPEPTTWSLLTLGIGVLLGGCRLRRRS